MTKVVVDIPEETHEVIREYFVNRKMPLGTKADRIQFAADQFAQAIPTLNRTGCYDLDHWALKYKPNHEPKGTH